GRAVVAGLRLLRSIHRFRGARRHFSRPCRSIAPAMMFARIDQRPVARWWWTIDRWSLGALVLLIAFGAVMSMAASPAVAERLGYARLHFAERHLVAAPVALAIMFGVSLMPPRS